jgi:hypothetical protein
MAEAEGLQNGGEVEGDGRRQEAVAATAGAVAGVPGTGALTISSPPSPRPLARGCYDWSW